MSQGHAEGHRKTCSLLAQISQSEFHAGPWSHAWPPGPTAATADGTELPLYVYFMPMPLQTARLTEAASGMPPTACQCMPCLAEVGWVPRYTESRPPGREGGTSETRQLTDKLDSARLLDTAKVHYCCLRALSLSVVRQQ